jgi:transcriptional regulator with XRE-family HTH domain
MADAARPDPPNRLHELRRLRGLTQNRLADLAGISGQQIGHLERGERRMTFAQAEILAPHLGCAPADLLSHAAGISVPVTCRVAAAFSESAPAEYDLPPPQTRVPALPGLTAPEQCFAAELSDDSADRMYPPGSVLVARPIGGRDGGDGGGSTGTVALGAKILLRRFTGSGRSRRTMEILVGLLRRGASGDLMLDLRTENRELPASVTIQHHDEGSAPGGRLDEIRFEPPSSGAVVDYAFDPADPGEIIGVVVMAITPE